MTVEPSLWEGIMVIDVGRHLRAALDMEAGPSPSDLESILGLTYLSLLIVDSRGEITERKLLGAGNF